MSEWISVEDETPTNEESMYWVFAFGVVKMCWLNEYPSQACWQCLSNNDFSMEGTKYIEVKKPNAPINE